MLPHGGSTFLINYNVYTDGIQGTYEYPILFSDASLNMIDFFYDYDHHVTAIKSSQTPNPLLIEYLKKVYGALMEAGKWLCSLSYVTFFQSLDPRKALQ